jgi:hypothetical protein
MEIFDIETYLNSLPENVTEIDISGKNLTYIPESIIRFKKLKILYCDDNRLTNLPVLPENLYMLDCADNQFTCLPVLPKYLKYIYCADNQLTYIPCLPENLYMLDCANNQLTHLPCLPENLEILQFNGNNIIFNILYSRFIFIIKNKVNIQNKFRYLYYCTKLKHKFIGYYLWSKRKNYLMFLEGTRQINDEEYTHNYILNEYVGRDIMSYI